MRKEAIFSEDRKQRYFLSRTWWDEPNQNSKLLGWAMQNPSKAGAVKDDPTIRKCVGFGRRWGFAGIVVVNLIPIVATDPWTLPPWSGPFLENEEYIKRALKNCNAFAVAWGAVNSGVARTTSWAEHVFRFRALAEGVPLVCIGRTKNGSPRHPSRASYTLAPEVWEF